MPRFDQPIEPMTLGNMREVGVRSLREGEASQFRSVVPTSWAAAAAIFALHSQCRSATMFLDQMRLCEGTAMRKTPPRFDVAVVATSDGRFTFQIFMVSSEPRTLKTSGQYYLTPADAAQAGHKMIASMRM